MKKEFDLPFGSGIRIFAILFLLVFVLIGTGCRSTKETVKASATFLHESSIKVTDKNKSSVVDSTTTEKKQSSETKDSSFTKVTDIWLSKPDSTGVQHIERLTITESGNVKQIVKDLSEKKRTISSQNEDSQIESDYKSETTAKEKQIQVAKQEPATKWPLIILSIGALVLVYFILKRFRILK